MLGKVQKKYKHAKRAINASHEPANRELIPYPSGQTHSRDGFNLAEFVFKASHIGKEDYNTLIARTPTPFTCFY